MKKLLLSLSLVLGLFAVAPIGIHAEECHDHEVYVSVYGEETVITPRTQICLDCGKGILYPSTVYGNWVVSEIRSCSHYTTGEDVVYKRPIITSYTCNVCKANSNVMSSQTKIECFGK